MKQALSSAIIFTLLLILPFSAKAQNPQFEKVSDEVKSRYESKRKLIKQELASFQENEWTGEYEANVSSIDVASFYWASSSGFTVRSGNELERTIERVNYGNLKFNGSLLTLSPEYIEKDKHTFFIQSSFMPVKWGEQHWLVPADKLILFIFAVNSGDYDEIQTFFLKSGDEQKSNDALSDVPKQYRKYLNLKPIKASVINVTANNDAYLTFALTLNAGKAEGVIEGMRLYLVKVKNVLVWIRITDVREHTSTARVESIGSSGNYNEEIIPKIGWNFISKLPQGY